MTTRIVCAEEKKTISLENSKVPHVALIFKRITLEDIIRSRPCIKGVNLSLVKFLGDHKKVQGWDFIKWNKGVALLIPKRYIILSRGKVLSICLLFKEKEQIEA